MQFLDPDYTALAILWRQEATRRGQPHEVKELNSLDWGDWMAVGIDGIYSAEIKEWGEATGNLDHLINQIKKQMPNCDQCYLFMYGEGEQAEDGNSYTLKLKKAEPLINRSTGVEYAYQKTYTRFHHRVNYTARQKILWRFRQEGIHVVEVPNLQELAVELCNLYEVATTLGTTFTRLVPDKYVVKGEDAKRVAFMKTLMGIQGAGIGEEIADAIASCMEGNGSPLTLKELIFRMSRETGIMAFVEQPLRSGKRKIGVSAMMKLDKALGSVPVGIEI